MTYDDSDWNMNCPNCDRPSMSGESFCRGCGAELMPGRPSRLRAAGIGVLSLVFVGLMVSIFGKMFEMKWLAYAGLAVMMTGAFIIAAYGFLRETRPRKRPIDARAERPPVQPLTKAPTTRKLPPVSGDDYIPSVIENTTDLLKTPAER